MTTEEKEKVGNGMKREVRQTGKKNTVEEILPLENLFCHRPHTPPYGGIRCRDKIFLSEV